MLLNCVFVGLGGAAGSICRYLLGLLPLKPASGFPAITLCINIAGAFALGLIGALAGKYAKLNPQLLLFLRVGVCGGFTTFSTFSNDGLILMKQGFYGLFATYTLLSILLGIFAALGGSIVGRTF
mgnify:FL=1